MSTVGGKCKDWELMLERLDGGSSMEMVRLLIGFSVCKI